MNLMATTNNSDNKTKLIVFGSSSGSAFRAYCKIFKMISKSLESNCEIKI